MLLIIFIIGLIIGSFINALVYRTRQAETKKSNLSIISGRSICPKCKHKLSTLDLIPLLSWLYLHGECRYCHKKISIEYPIVELSTALIFIFSYIFWPVNLNGSQYFIFISWLIILIGLITLFIYDLHWKILPTKIIYFTFCISVIYALLNIIINDNSLLNSLIGSLIGGGIFYIIYQISKGKWIGGGDVRLGFVLGLIVGTPEKAFMLLFIASLLGCIVTLPLIYLKRLKTSSIIPFGPFLIASTYILVLFGNNLINFYNKIFGL